MEQLITIGEHIINHREQIVKTIDQHQNPDRESTVSNDEVMSLRLELIETIGQAFLQSDRDQIISKIHEWGQSTGEMAVQFSVDLSSAMRSMPLYRSIILENIEELSLQEHFDLQSVFEANRTVNMMIDEAVYSFSKAYVNHHKRTLEAAMMEMDELSVPVVPLTDEVGVLPLVGMIDTHRAGILRDKTSKTCIDLQLELLVIDLSGVPIIDTMVAQKLFEVIQSLRLLGIKTMITGMRPELAQTMVQLGLSFEGIQVTGTLKQALKGLGSISI